MSAPARVLAAVAVAAVAAAAACDAAGSGAPSRPAPGPPLGPAPAAGATAARPSGAGALLPGERLGFDEQLLATAARGTVAGQVLDGSGRPVKDCVAYVKDGLKPAKYPAPSRPVVFDQRDKKFLPHLAAVLTGTTVEFKNSDGMLHNVYSRSPVKTFDLGNFSKDVSKTTVFDFPGRVDVFCAVHPNMHAVVLVRDNPFFAQTDARGYFEIRDAPPGSYGIRIWCERSEEQVVPVVLAAGKPAVVRVKLP